MTAQNSNSLDLEFVLAFPITDVPLALAHGDGTLNKTNKAALTKALESFQDSDLIDSNLPAVDTTIIN